MAMARSFPFISTRVHRGGRSLAYLGFCQGESQGLSAEGARVEEWVREVYPLPTVGGAVFKSMCLQQKALHQTSMHCLVSMQARGNEK